jgi:predicted O-methyltransferase YrrM
MTQVQWTAVDGYFNGLLSPPDLLLEAALRASVDAGLPSINVAANQGKLLMLLAQSIGARRILEVGTLGGYSTIWLARALPADGRLVTLELDPNHAEVARANLERAGLGGMVEVRQGRALDSLPQVEADGVGPFDFVFIDADKPSNADYFTWALKLTRPGALIVVDNVIRQGSVIQKDSADANVIGVRRLADLIAKEPRVDATAIQTVGDKGWDGFLIARVRQG